MRSRIEIVEIKAPKSTTVSTLNNTKVRALEKQIHNQAKQIENLRQECQDLRDKAAQVLEKYEETRRTLRKALEEVKIRTADRDTCQRQVEKLQAELTEQRARQRKTTQGEKICNYQTKVIKKKTQAASKELPSRGRNKTVELGISGRGL
uniref:Uncharacterized protein n=1 Tax=Knipowitschia caucasica TaxID=637954 RepID=A0AAV2MPT2_KNICA